MKKRAPQRDSNRRLSVPPCASRGPKSFSKTIKLQGGPARISARTAQGAAQFAFALLTPRGEGSLERGLLAPVSKLADAKRRGTMSAETLPPLTLRSAMVTGRRKRRGPALPGL